MLQAHSASVHSCHPMENTVHCMSFDLLPNAAEIEWQNSGITIYSYMYLTINNSLINGYLQFTGVMFVSRLIQRRVYALLANVLS